MKDILILRFIISTKILTVCILLCLLISCSEHENKSITLSACAKSLSNGDIVECDGNKESNLDAIFQFLNELDQIDPGPQIPEQYKYHRAESVNEKGIIKLKNGKKIAFAGMECNHIDLKKYLYGFLIKDKDVRVVYLPTGYTNNNIVYAYIWEVIPEVAKEYRQRGLNNYGNPIHETALFGKWCKPVKQKHHKFHSRFTSIYDFVETLL